MLVKTESVVPIFIHSEDEKSTWSGTFIINGETGEVTIKMNHMKAAMSLLRSLNRSNYPAVAIKMSPLEDGQ